MGGGGGWVGGGGGGEWVIAASQVCVSCYPGLFSSTEFNPYIERERTSSENDLESKRSYDTHSFDVILSIHLLVL